MTKTELKSEWERAGAYFSKAYKVYLRMGKEFDDYRAELVKKGKEPKEDRIYLVKRRANSKIARVYMRAGDRSLALYEQWKAAAPEGGA
jgi:hypothetical protein